MGSFGRTLSNLAPTAHHSSNLDYAAKPNDSQWRCPVAQWESNGKYSRSSNAICNAKLICFLIQYNASRCASGAALRGKLHNAFCGSPQSVRRAFLMTYIIEWFIIFIVYTTSVNLTVFVLFLHLLHCCLLYHSHHILLLFVTTAPVAEDVHDVIYPVH